VAGWSVQPCVRPVSAVRMTAGHNAFRGSGPGQNLAFKHALALVGCPDRWIDRLCITCCSSSQPSHHAGSRRDLVGPLTAPTSVALACLWRSRPQHQDRTSAGTANFDHLVGACEQRQRHVEAERLGRLQIDYKFVFRRRACTGRSARTVAARGWVISVAHHPCACATQEEARPRLADGRSARPWTDCRGSPRQRPRR